MRIHKIIQNTLNRTILRNLVLIVGLSSLLLTFPFRRVWAEYSFLIGEAVSCERNSDTNIFNILFPVQCEVWANCVYAGGDEPLPYYPQPYPIGLRMSVWGFCPTSPVRSSVYLWAYPGDKQLMGHGNVTVLATGLPLVEMININLVRANILKSRWFSQRPAPLFK
jgi:hypothetical protein